MGGDPAHILEARLWNRGRRISCLGISLSLRDSLRLLRYISWKIQTRVQVTKVMLCLFRQVFRRAEC